MHFSHGSLYVRRLSLAEAPQGSRLSPRCIITHLLSPVDDLQKMKTLEVMPESDYVDLPSPGISGELVEKSGKPSGNTQSMSS